MHSWQFPLELTRNRRLALLRLAPMQTKSPKIRKALTIAGSDSGAGAGIQADLKTFAALGVHGTSVITAVTAQNPKGVLGVQATGLAMVNSQLAAVFDAVHPQAIKTGMLFSAAVIKEI